MHAKVARVQEGIIGTGVGSRIDVTPNSEPAGFPPRRDKFFQGGVQNKLHAWVPQAALGSG
eukprot:2549163-Heterocapsa_arctica.AAC.1